MIAPPPGFELENSTSPAGVAPPPGFEMVPPPAGFEIISEEFDEPGLEIDIVGGIPESQARATDNMSGYDRFMAGIGKSIVDTGYGLAQQAIAIPSTAVRAGSALSNAVLPEGSRLRELNQRASDIALAPQNSLRATAAERRAIDSDLMSTGAGLAGNVTGTVAQLLTPAMLARGTSLAALAAPTSVRGNAVQGAVLGSLQPSTGMADSAQQAALGGALGGAGAGVINAGGSALSALRNMGSNAGLTSAERRAAEVLARESTNPQALDVVESVVPGVRRTFGEATQDPGLMALENTLRAQNRGAFDAIDMQNNAARVRQLEGIAGTDGDMAAAIAARDDYSMGLLDRAMAEGASSAQAAQQMAPLAAGAPVQQSGFAQLREGISSIAQQGAGNPNVQNATNAVSRALGQAGDSVSGLYNVRKYIGDLLNGKAAGDDASARAASRELIQMRELIDSELSRRAPSFPEYLDAYRTASKPINRMDVGREVLGRAGSAIPDMLGNPTLTPAATFRATNDLDAIAAKATGFKKAKASEILTPDDISVIRAIQDDMARISSRQRSAVPGSQTRERQSIGERLGRNSIASRTPVVGQILEHFERNANEALQEKLAYLMANPAEAKRVMDALPSGERSALRNTLNQLALAGTKGSAVSTN